MFLKISLTKGVIRFGVRGKLNPKYIGPFEILERVGEVAYRLALLSSLEGVHNMFHVSKLSDRGETVLENMCVLKSVKVLVVFWLPRYYCDSIAAIRVESTKTRGNRSFIGYVMKMLMSSS